jgi:hypothetical protein
MSTTHRAMHRWGFVDEFNEVLDQTLEQGRAVGEVREDLRER